MRRSVGGWVESIRSVGEAALELLRSELAAVGEDLSASGRGLMVAAGLFLGAAFLVFWALGLLAYVGLEILALWLPRWASGLILLGLLVLVILILVALGRARIRRLETPASTVRRRLDDHRQWWRREVEGRVLPAARGSAEPRESLSSQGSGRE